MKLSTSINSLRIDLGVLYLPCNCHCHIFTPNCVISLLLEEYENTNISVLDFTTMIDHFSTWSKYMLPSQMIIYTIKWNTILWKDFRRLRSTKFLFSMNDNFRWFSILINFCNDNFPWMTMSYICMMSENSRRDMKKIRFFHKFYVKERGLPIFKRSKLEKTCCVMQAMGMSQKCRYFMT